MSRLVTATVSCCDNKENGQGWQRFEWLPGYIRECEFNLNLTDGIISNSDKPNRATVALL